jgi:hypothetical protein
MAPVVYSNTPSGEVRARHVTGTTNGYHTKAKNNHSSQSWAPSADASHRTESLFYPPAFIVDHAETRIPEFDSSGEKARVIVVSSGPATTVSPAPPEHHHRKLW